MRRIHTLKVLCALQWQGVGTNRSKTSIVKLYQEKIFIRLFVYENIFTQEKKLIRLYFRWLLKPGTERNRLFHFVLFQILHHEAMQHSLNLKNFDLGIPNPKSNLLLSNRKIKECSIPFRSILFRVLVTALFSSPSYSTEFDCFKIINSVLLFLVFDSGLLSA